MDKEALKKVLAAFIDNEASELTLGELAQSLLDEVNEGGSLENLPPLKQAVLDYAQETASNLDADDDA